ncbi:uncharacterized protein N7482_000102 [Penicillium canariense]|uniref:Uncharacterized protein n=1 Tax=Penicillium canariense TaxID=189055 RepID=A0A9W9IB69_9EURO|nr:uncharacterized protein N7482_000102 [Penicillium canariense]KAJ5174225.1 hypothetical protein N7482_000102 [Penicillium canariense]
MAKVKKNRYLDLSKADLELPSLKEDTRFISANNLQFYNALIKAYDDREVEKEEVLPPLSLKYDRSVYITRIRYAIRTLKLPVPYEVCKDNGTPRQCYYNEVIDTYEYFDMFVDPCVEVDKEDKPKDKKVFD